MEDVEPTPEEFERCGYTSDGRPRREHIHACSIYRPGGVCDCGYDAGYAQALDDAMRVLDVRRAVHAYG